MGGFRFTVTEKDFQVDLARGLRAQGCFCQKWPDLARAVVKPFDLCMGYDRQFYAIECKLTKVTAKRGLTAETKVLCRNDFRPHQLPTLIDLYARDQAIPYIAVCVAWQEGLGRMKKRAWLFPAHIYCDERLDTITLQEMEDDYDAELIWKPGVGWLVPWLPYPSQEP